MAEKKTDKYIEAVGRRKTAVARVRITPSKQKDFDINGKDLSTYFPVKAEQQTVESALAAPEEKKTFKVSARLIGGGVKAQAEALRHGISRALVIHDQSLRGVLKSAGFLKRDPRSKERKKFGLRKARRAPQWSKR